MKQFLIHYMGVALIVVGALLLMVAYFWGYTSYNAVLLLCLMIILLGAYLHVKTVKKEGSC